jgi:ParB/RepB/Spo0J family partition protein
MNKSLRKKLDEMRAKFPNNVLLFNVGDFYEAYDSDAEFVAEVLGLTLTKKGDTKMAGFPRHSLDTYLPKLVRTGKRVAMCDMLNGRQEAEPLPKRATTELPSPVGEVKKIEFTEIFPSPMNPRKTFDEEAICELADSIKQHGLLQPITVRPKDKAYEIIMGERRFRAWQENCRLDPKFPREIPCIVRVMTDEEALDAMITENLQRKDVDPIEEAFAFGQLHAHGKTIEEIALRFGKSARFITERIKLDKLLPELKQWVTKGWMNIGAAMHICKLTEDEQQSFVNQYTKEEVGDDTDPITKQDAMDFTNDLFMTIDRADWSRDFTGSCGTTCEKCPFNNANVGCLFYEMKPHDATCTNRERWNKKRHSWLLNMVEENADVLVKYGEDLETGKTVVVAEPNSYYAERNPEYEPLLERIKEMGFEVVSKDDYFERWSSYQEGDERLQEKLDNNELYRCLVVEAGWRGTEIHVRYYQFKKQGTEQSSDEVNAMQLVNEYKENQRKSTTALASKLRDILRDMEPTELSTEPLNQTESLVLMTLILKKCSYQLRNALNINSTYSPDPQVLNYAKAHAEQVHQICRDFIREELASAGVEYNTDLQVCQSMLLQEWAKEKTEEMSTDNALRLAKKQAKIEEQLTALGYNTDGTKMDF